MTETAIIPAIASNTNGLLNRLLIVLDNAMPLGSVAPPVAVYWPVAGL